MFSIVIPSKNEEAHIGALLSSIKEQTVQPESIILADKSTDRTREIASQYDVTIIEGQDDGFIGKARNNGAAVAKGDILIFIDADSELTTCTFLEDALTCFEALDLDLASCYHRPSVKNWKSTITFSVMNLFKRLDNMAKYGMSNGSFLIVKKEVFNNNGRFKEDIKISEDLDFGFRAVKNNYKYGVLPLYLLTFPGRFGTASPLSIIASALGGVGTIMTNALDIQFLKPYKDKFEHLYGETGGDRKRKRIRSHKP